MLTDCSTTVTQYTGNYTYTVVTQGTTHMVVTQLRVYYTYTVVTQLTVKYTYTVLIMTGPLTASTGSLHSATQKRG